MRPIDDFLDKYKLIYQCDSEPGISRKGKPGSFFYIDHKGIRISNLNTLDRIKKLVIPPAWKDVWISTKKNAHLQATGIDGAGRKQYKYHSLWSEKRNDTKFHNLYELGRGMSVFRKRLDKDLRRPKLDMEKVLAIAVSFMLQTNIRVGNEAYEKAYGTYGLSTLRDRHIVVEGARLKLSYKGKKGIFHKVELSDRRLSRLVRKCRDIPGQELFQYYENDGSRKSIDSGMVNDYIRNLSNKDFTAKDLRTWAGTLEALKALSDIEDGSDKKKAILSVLDLVSNKLGNTRVVCRKYYVYPELIKAYELGELDKQIKELRKANMLAPEKQLLKVEKKLIAFLKSRTC